MRGKGLSISLTFLFVLASCRSVTPPRSAVTLATVEVYLSPWGSTVTVDGTPKGETPLILTLPPGSHRVRVEKEGYEPLEREVTLASGQRESLGGELKDIAAPTLSLSPLPDQVEEGRQLAITLTASDNERVKGIELLIDGALVYDSAGDSLFYLWDTSSIPGEHLVLGRAYDEEGNMGERQAEVVINSVETATATPTTIPIITPKPTPLAVQVTVKEAEITIPSYPYEAYLREAFDTQYGTPYLWLDRAAYESASHTLVEKRFKAIILENEYLRLTIVPELGGRIYKCLFKPTGQNLFYENSVLKPSYWGPLTREENWWLAAGGMEWAFPKDEHGYEWGTPWQYSIGYKEGGITLSLWDTEAERLRVKIDISLLPGRAYFTLRPHIENPASIETQYQFWSNALLTLGNKSISPETRFIYPTPQVIVHGSGDPNLPQAGERMSWPIYKGRDMSWYGNWVGHLGLFIPQPSQDFVGAYNHESDLGVARIFPHQEAPGVKLFAMGSGFPYTDTYTDDGSQYFEIWGGATPTFWEYATLGPGEAKEWVEYWYPFWGTGGLDFANERAALNLEAREGVVVLGVATTSLERGTISLLLDGQEIHREAVTISPAQPYRREIPIGAPGLFILRLLGPGGESIIQYEE